MKQPPLEKGERKLTLTKQQSERRKTLVEHCGRVVRIWRRGNRRKTNNNITQRWLLKLFSFVQSSFLTPNRVDISFPCSLSRCSLLFGFTWLRIWIVLAAICVQVCVCVCVCWPISLSSALHLALVWRLFTALGNKLALGKLALLAILMFFHKKQRQIQLNLYWQASRLATLAGKWWLGCAN